MNLDWKWIGIGALIMLGLGLVAGVILGVVLGSSVDPNAPIEEISVTGGQIALAVILNFLAFLIGGYIVGIKSAGRTILEPGIAAAVAVAVVLLLSRQFSVVNIIAGGLVPFLAGVLGGWLGEKRQDAKTATTS